MKSKQREAGRLCGIWLSEEHTVYNGHRLSTEKPPQGALDIDAFVSPNRGSWPPWDRQASARLIMISTVAFLLIIRY